MTPIHLKFRLNRQQTQVLFRLSAEGLRQQAGWRCIPQILGIVIVVSMAVLGLQNVQMLPWWGGGILLWIVGILLWLFGSVLYGNWFYDKYAKSIGEHQITLDDDGLLIGSELAQSRYAWAAIRAIRVQTEGVAIVIGNLPVVQYVPESAFPDVETRRAFLAAMREHGVAGVPDVASAEPPLSVAAEIPASGFLTDLAQLGRILTFRAPRVGTLTPAAWKFILLVLIFGALCFGVQVWENGFSGGRVYRDGVQALLQPLALIALIAGFARWIGGKEVDGARLWLALTFLSLLLPFAEAWQNQAWTGHWHWLRLIPAIWFVLVTGALMGRTSARTARNIAAELLLVISLPMFFLTVSTPTVWYVPYDEEDDDVSRYLRLDETVLYEQPALLEAALNEVKPGKPGVPELFFLGVGGHQQNVFLRETRAVETLFAERFDTAGHSLLLVNHKDTAHTLPMANLTSLRQALARMGERMNEEDTLFLLLTSHGTPDHLLSFQLWPFDFTDLSPKTLRQALDDARIKRRVVVVSACYSGGFMPALRDENTLVITAAAADRTSFGCNDENEFTEFGRAYFDEALRETRSFTRAFDLAAKRIAEREKAKGLTPSLPQMQGGEGLQLAED